MRAHLAEALARRPAADLAPGRIAANSGALRVTRRAALIAALLAVVAAAGWWASGRAHEGINAPVARGVIERTNAARADAGLPPLAANRQLTRAAETYAREMARQAWFDHSGPDGASVETRAEAAGYINWDYLAENLATGPNRPDAAGLVSGWLNSEDHRRNILSPDLSEIGVACYAVDGSPVRYWCAQEFGTRAP